MTLHCPAWGTRREAVWNTICRSELHRLAARRVHRDAVLAPLKSATSQAVQPGRCRSTLTQTGRIGLHSGGVRAGRTSQFSATNRSSSASAAAAPSTSPAPTSPGRLGVSAQAFPEIWRPPLPRGVGGGRLSATTRHHSLISRGNPACEQRLRPTGRLPFPDHNLSQGREVMRSSPGQEAASKSAPRIPALCPRAGGTMYPDPVG